MHIMLEEFTYKEIKKDSGSPPTGRYNPAQNSLLSRGFSLTRRTRSGQTWMRMNLTLK
jgi:hypothetical protein